MRQEDESYPPEDNWQSGAHLTIKFTGEPDSQVSEMQSPGLQAGDFSEGPSWALVSLPIKWVHWSPQHPPNKLP